MNKLIPLLAFSILLLVPVGTQNAFAATIMTYDDKAAFLADTGAASTGPIPNIGNAPGTTTIGDVDITGLMDFGVWTVRIPGFDIAINDVEDFDIDINSADAVYSLGFDFVEPEFDPNVNAPFSESTFEVTLKNGAIVVDTFTFERPNDSLEFVGVWSDMTFDRVEIRETTGGIENEFFGEILIGILPLQIVGGEFVPIDSIALILAGLQTSAIWLAPVVISAVGIGLVLVRRK